MKQLIYLLVLSLPIITVLKGCIKDEEIDSIESSDDLERFGILGKWGLQSRTIDGITNMIIHYDTIEFMVDNEVGDLQGKFRNINGQFETNGEFNLDTIRSIIQFDFNETQRYYEFGISNDLMTFTYSEDSMEVIEDWRKKE